MPRRTPRFSRPVASHPSGTLQTGGTCRIRTCGPHRACHLASDRFKPLTQRSKLLPGSTPGEVLHVLRPIRWSGMTGGSDLAMDGLAGSTRAGYHHEEPVNPGRGWSTRRQASPIGSTYTLSALFGMPRRPFTPYVFGAAWVSRAHPDLRAIRAVNSFDHPPSSYCWSQVPSVGNFCAHRLAENPA